MFHSDITIEKLNSLGHGNMGDHLGIEFIELGADYLCAKMPVDHRTRQPYGLLHGGASCVLAETMGSIGSLCCVDMAKFDVVGVEINANHLRSVKEGFVYAKAQVIHLGRRLHVWDIKIKNESEKLVCISRLTTAILPKRDVFN